MSKYIYDYFVTKNGVFRMEKLKVERELEDQYIVVNPSGYEISILKSDVDNHSYHSNVFNYLSLERDDAIASDYIYDQLKRRKAAQIESMLKNIFTYNQEMDAHIEALRKNPIVTEYAGAKEEIKRMQTSEDLHKDWHKR